MIIEVNTKEQMETFYKSLSKYRFYRRTVFQTNLKDKELQMIIKALNRFYQ